MCRVPCSAFLIPCSAFRIPCSVLRVRVPSSTFCTMKHDIARQRHDGWGNDGSWHGGAPFVSLSYYFCPLSKSHRSSHKFSKTRTHILFLFHNIVAWGRETRLLLCIPRKLCSGIHTRYSSNHFVICPLTPITIGISNTSIPHIRLMSIRND